jgi:hypothetical protein
MKNTARPEPIGCAEEKEEQEHCGGGMQQHVCQVVAARMKLIELGVEHQRDPRQWDPHLLPAMGERVDNVRPGHPAHDMGVLADVGVVVEIEELVADGLAEHECDDQQQEATDGELFGIESDFA